MTNPPLSNNQSADQQLLFVRLWGFYHLACKLESCERAITEYAAAGISGTTHDIEHHKMRNEAMAQISVMVKL